MKSKVRFLAVFETSHFFKILTCLEIHSSNLHGTISDALGNLTSLVELDLSYNLLEGTISTSLANLCNLREIDLTILNLSINKFSGNPFESLGSLSKLSSLRIDGNNFQGVVKEDDLANLTSLKEFHAPGNNFTLKVGPIGFLIFNLPIWK